jgi:G6PDH family F420-dependent oxidoreductase
MREAPNVEIGYFLSCEEHTPSELMRGAQVAEQAGFSKAWISDHFHPWNDAEGQSPFVWAVLGGIAQATQLHVTTAVTCPAFRLHPVIIAQAAATAACMFDGRFSLGVGTGEALNEHVTGLPWPRVAVRQAMLEEAVDIIRRLWQGSQVSVDGEYFAVDNARIYTLPDTPPDILVSGFGPESTKLAARIGDGFMTVSPDGEAVRTYRDEGGKGLVQGGLKVCWGPDMDEARRTAHRLWGHELIPGQFGQDAPTPAHFEQVSTLVTEEMVADKVVHGPDPQPYVDAIREYAGAGFDELYIGQMGPDQEGMIRFLQREVLPEFR